MESLDDGYIISDKNKPCCVCGKLTNRIEYNYEAYICSLECENKMNQEWERWYEKRIA